MRTKHTSEKAILVFDEARKLFLGSKRGLKTEFSNFVWRSKHPLAGKPKFVIIEILPLLKPAIERQIIWRQADGRYWKNFQTWINQRCWEEEQAKGQTTPLQKDVSFGKCCYRCGSSEKYDGRTGVIWREKFPWCSTNCYEKWVKEGKPKYD